MTSFGAQQALSSGQDGDSHLYLANLRDVAGLRLTGGGTVPPGRLYRSDAPYPGDAVPRTVPVWPPSTVIDLRSHGETPTGYPWPSAVSVHHVPLMRQAAVVSAPGGPPGSAPPLPSSVPALYARLLDMVPGRLARLIGLAADSPGPVLVHCTAGKDRTGVAVAVLLLAGGAEPDDIVADYTATEGNMRGLLDRLAGLGRSLPARVDPDSELLRAPAEAIGGVLDRLTGWPGGPQGWAVAHGASAGDLRRWRERLTADR